MFRCYLLPPPRWVTLTVLSQRSTCAIWFPYLCLTLYLYLCLSSTLAISVASLEVFWFTKQTIKVIRIVANCRSCCHFHCHCWCLLLTLPLSLSPFPCLSLSLSHFSRSPCGYIISCHNCVNGIHQQNSRKYENILRLSLSISVYLSDTFGTWC